MLRPTAKEVKVLNDYMLVITFDNGEKKLFDAEILLTKKPFFPLKNKSVFESVHTNGITIEWGEDIDICPDDLYYGSVAMGKEIPV
ncbi:MAG: DUF2442 domain-containing protein [Bacteroidota bacterium]|jgi:hypothetical protein